MGNEDGLPKMMYLRFVMLGFLIFCPFTTMAQETVPENKKNEKIALEDNLFWVFLTTGKSTEGVPPKEVQQMQEAHLSNFKSLAEQQKLLTAGPMLDPEKKLRGIVVVRAESVDDLNGFFKDDPYIQNGYLKVEATAMEFKHGVINTKITPQGLEEYRLVVLEKNGSEHTQTDEEAKDNVAFIESMSSNKDLLLSALLPDGKFGRTAVLIMSKKDGDEKLIADAIDQIPAVQSRAWKSRIFPLRMGKGTLTAG